MDAAARVIDECGRLARCRHHSHEVTRASRHGLQVLEQWDPSRALFACDIRPGAPPLHQFAQEAMGGGLLIGPEGGLSESEWDVLDGCGYVRRVTLGANTLRAETAAMAALAVVSCAAARGGGG